MKSTTFQSSCVKICGGGGGGIIDGGGGIIGGSGVCGGVDVGMMELVLMKGDGYGKDRKK